jgi:hypothetical protein
MPMLQRLVRILKLAFVVEVKMIRGHFQLEDYPACTFGLAWSSAWAFEALWNERHDSPCL